MVEAREKPAAREWGKAEVVGGRHRFRLQMMMEQARRLVPARARVLDAGCGDGALTMTLLRAGYRVSAVEFSSLSLGRLADKMREAAAKDTPLALENVSLASLTALPFPDQSFDATISGEVLEHVPDDCAAARELARVLRPGGVLILTVPANPALWGIEDEWAGHQRRYTREGLRELMTAQGLKVEDLHFWGWPITWLYNRILFRVWLKRRLKKGDPDSEPAGLGANPLLQKLMAIAFSMDRLCFRLPFGIGLIGVFRKPRP